MNGQVKLARDLPVGVACVTYAYAAQLCPDCQQAAAWVGDKLRCVACSGVFVPSQAWLQAASRRFAAGRAVLLCDSFERLQGYRIGKRGAARAC